MSTKVTIIGEDKPSSTKCIEFIKACQDGVWVTPITQPCEWANIELIARNFVGIFDLMFAYDTNRRAGVLYLGHFNDGIV